MASNTRRVGCQLQRNVGTKLLWHVELLALLFVLPFLPLRFSEQYREETVELITVVKNTFWKCHLKWKLCFFVLSGIFKSMQIIHIPWSVFSILISELTSVLLFFPFMLKSQPGKLVPGWRTWPPSPAREVVVFAEQSQVVSTFWWKTIKATIK